MRQQKNMNAVHKLGLKKEHNFSFRDETNFLFKYSLKYMLSFKETFRFHEIMAI